MWDTIPQFSHQRSRKKQRPRYKFHYPKKEEAFLSLKTSEKPRHSIKPFSFIFYSLSCALMAEGERGREPRSDSNAIASPKVVPMEDFVQALMDYLVDPVLPLKSAARDAPSISQQQRVAKQMHAVVMLYNYYHRRQFPMLEFLCFESFCKVAVNAKPNLLVYMTLMQGCSFGEDDPGKQLSIMEKVIMDACNICIDLDASKDGSRMEGWPISKVTVFLIDFKKKNCLLLFGSITEGVWSLIERDSDDLNPPSEGILEGKDGNKRTRITKRSLRDEPSAREAAFQQFAFSAIKERTNIDQSDLMLLESHVVYSITKGKTAAWFYLMQCTKPINEDIIQVPIKDAVNSLQGPMVKKISGNYMVTPAVEYFHLLPYAGIMSDWLSREENPNRSSLSHLVPGNVNIGSSLGARKVCSIEVYDSSDTSNRTFETAHIVHAKTIDKLDETLNQKEIDASPRINSKAENYSSTACPPSPDKGKSIAKIVPANHLEGKTTASGEDDLGFTRSSSKDKVEMLGPVVKICSKENTGVKVAGKNDLRNFGSHGRNATPSEDNLLVPLKSNGLEPDKIQAVMASRENELLRNALKLLQQKRDDLYQHQRDLEDEIAQCEKNLQIILSGGKDDLILKIESILEACTVACSSGTTRTYGATQLNMEKQSSLQSLKRRRFSEAILNLQDPCQELDAICLQNNWILPKYSVFPLDGGYNANVTVKGMDFECPCSGDIQADPREARESAASNVLRKLRNMASQRQ
ncbi:hypothetical protein NE237_014820 [Protea cynaroides]|uniref:DRBM domain-containing protein n=1 Tax=Protea cynaroides TaxID=273540 RepID=A0A9Q0KCW0_9MAGN|nr:hypothetical protein NE237_014820 [Protea cynaroides]